MRGKMLWFNEAEDRGFIETDDGERLSVLGPGFVGGERPAGRCAETVVTFEIDDSDGTRQAANVAFAPEVSARRARMRGRGGRW
jgi:hypothetical protein